MSKRKVACFVVFGATAVTLAAYSATAQRAQQALPAEQASGDFSPQTPNRAAKTNRLLIQTALETGGQNLVFALASAVPDLPMERAPGPATASAPKIPEPEPAAKATPPAAEPKAEPKAAKAAPTLREKIADKAKHLLLLPPPAHSGSFLDDGQISGLKNRLRLSSDQAEYWPAVEEALRDVVRTQLRGQHAVRGKVNIDTNSPEVQKLIWAAMPLLMRLREDQKGEVRKLARVIGLEQVASQI